jgi:hypothetical protein
MRLEFVGRQDPQVDFLDDVSVTLSALPTAAPTLGPTALLLTMIGLACAGWYMGRGRMRIKASSPEA